MNMTGGDVRSLISCRFPLNRTPEAFALNDRYGGDAVKIFEKPIKGEIHFPPLRRSK